MEAILKVPQPIVFIIFDHLSVEKIWQMRTVCKTLYNLCRNYFEEKLDQLFIDKEWLCDPWFGRTVSILTNCKSLTKLSIEIQGVDSLINIEHRIVVILSQISRSNCKLSECSLIGIYFSSGDPLPNISQNLAASVKLVLQNVISKEWKNVLNCFLSPHVEYTRLKYLSLQLTKYDGFDLINFGNNCPNLIALDVSYCSHIKREYLEQALRQWSKLMAVHLLYVPTVKDSTIKVLKEYCPFLETLCVQGTCVSVDILTALSLRGVYIDVLENDFPKHKRVPLQSC